MKQQKQLATAIAAHSSGDLVNSEILYRKFLRTNPANHTANNNLGLVLLSLGRADEAALFFQKLVKMFPQDKYALINLGNCCAYKRQFDQALNCYQRSIEAFPEFELAWYNYANCLKDMDRFEESLSAYDKALTFGNKNARTWANRGISLYRLRRYEEALRSQEQSISLDPTLVEALINRGTTLLALKRHKEALASIEHALMLRPDSGTAWSALGDVLRALKRYQYAAQAYEKAISITPDADNLPLGSLINSKQHLCDWSIPVSETRRQIHDALMIGKTLVDPFVLLSLSDSPKEQLTAARTFIKEMRLAAPDKLRVLDRNGRRLRVAYISGDLREHPVTTLMRGVFESHDRKRIETFAVSFHEYPESPVQLHLKTQFEHWLNIEEESDDLAVERLRALEIDIAIDLTGHTEGSRIRIFARRIAPIQVNYLGYPGTLGADYMDYIIADRYVIPVSEVPNYSEHIVYLPDCFQANVSSNGLPKKLISRGEIGIPEGCFVFCCLNNSYKISQEVFAVWMKLLIAIDGSVLWLLGESEDVRKNLCKAAISYGLEADRIVFTQRRDYDEYLASYSMADLFLDTYPFNAGTTASDALRAGLPILTCSGLTFASRMAGSLLHAIGLPELVTNSLKQYEDKALELAQELNLLTNLRTRLERNLHSTALYNTERFTRNLEVAYFQMYDQALKENNAVDFAVDCKT